MKRQSERSDGLSTEVPLRRTGVDLGTVGGTWGAVLSPPRAPKAR